MRVSCMKKSTVLLSLVPLGFCMTPVHAQGFGLPQAITTSADYANSVYAIDLDGDGDADVLSASEFDGKIAWYRNRLNKPKQDFSSPRIISNSAYGVCSVYATDLDGDGDADVLVANGLAHTIAWYENMGLGGTFGGEQVITKQAAYAHSAYAIDLDGDGDADVLSASYNDNKIAWYKNKGGGVFDNQQVITNSAIGAWSVFATDLDGDGDADVLSASISDDKIAWYENQGGGVFGGQQVITTSADGATSVYATDLDGDGDADVLSASWNDDKIAWYENLIPPDCNGNGTPDDQEIAGDPSLDWNGDGVLDECTPPNYCTANPNSTGQIAVMSVSGSPIITDNNFTLTASQLPTFEFGYFLMAASQGFIPNVGGSGGNLCLGFPFYRFSKPPTGTVLSSGSGGTFSFTPDLTNLPQNVTFMIGETWDFQAWYRDGSAGTSNFTDGIEVMFR